MTKSHVRDYFVILVLTVGSFLACQRPNGYVGDVSMSMTVPELPQLSGKLYMRGNSLRVDWGEFADVFDLKQRKGWRIITSARGYQELGSKDLSTFAPEMTDGSMCPHAQWPSGCSLVGSETTAGRKVTKWDLLNIDRGYHVYFWTDDILKITLRMDIGGAAGYELKNLRQSSVPDSMFELPAGYTKLERTYRP